MLTLNLGMKGSSLHSSRKCNVLAQVFLKIKLRQIKVTYLDLLLTLPLDWQRGAAQEVLSSMVGKELPHSQEKAQRTHLDLMDLVTWEKTTESLMYSIHFFFQKNITSVIHTVSHRQEKSITYLCEGGPEHLVGRELVLQLMVSEAQLVFDSLLLT